MITVGVTPSGNELFARPGCVSTSATIVSAPNSIDETATRLMFKYVNIARFSALPTMPPRAIEDSRLASWRNRYASVAALARASGSGLSCGRITIGADRAIACSRAGNIARLFPACPMRGVFGPMIIAVARELVHARTGLGGVVVPSRRSATLRSDMAETPEPRRFFLERYGLSEGELEHI